MENRGDETGGGDEEREDCVLGNTKLGKGEATVIGSTRIHTRGQS